MCKITTIYKKFAVVLPIIFLTGVLNAQDSLKLSKQQERYLLKTTVKTHVMGLSTFDSFASYLNAMSVAIIHTDNPEVANTRLRSFPYPDRKISLSELFDEIGKQTSSKWSYDEKHNYWLFSKPLTFEIELAQGWRKEIRKGYIFYKPPSAPVGMDIYFAGRVDSAETASDARIRIAEKYANPIITGITAASMKELSLAHQNALFYKTEIPNKDIIWRQWAIVEKGRCFVIVSAIKLKDEAALLPDVEKMVQSFQVIDIGN